MQKDPIFDLIQQEKTRQNEGLELIPSENYVSPAVLSAMGSILTNKYSEGYPSFEGLHTDSEAEIAKNCLANYRYYGGQVNIDRIERLAIARACKLFSADHANVQPHSGAQANNAVYNAWLDPGDTILGLDLSHGGHLTHGSPVTQAAHIYNFINYQLDPITGDLNYDQISQLAKKHHPKILLVGYSAFSKIPDFQRIANIASGLKDCLLMADMAHVAGLIAGKVHPNPLDYGFHVMTSTTHKTLRGPRGGLILTKGIVSNPLKAPQKTLENIPTLIDRSVFPGTQGGPHEHIIAAKAVAFREALQPEFHDYAENILKNSQALTSALKEYGFKIVGDSSDNHLILLDVKQSFGIDGKSFEIALDKIGLTLNANSIPNDPLPYFRPSGVRLGTPAMTTRELSTDDMQKIADWMYQVAILCQAPASAEQDQKYAHLKNAVKALALAHPIP